MFKRLASEALGLSDIGIIVPPSEYNKVDADDYLFSEDGEKIFFLIKSKKDEYCFTNLGLIHVDGDSAVSSKRTIRRYEFASHPVSEVVLETAGTIDMDVELKFVLDHDTRFSIDVRKNFIEQLKDVYKALITIGKIQKRDELARANALECLQVAGAVYKLNSVAADDSVAQQFNTLLAHYNAATLDRFTRRDFSAVFERYIHN